MVSLSMFDFRRNRLVQELAGNIAKACRSAACDRVLGKTAGMSLAETRGYIRARSADLIETHANTRTLPVRLDSRARQRVLMLATQRLVEGVILDMARAGTRWSIPRAA
jgi:hypothetical protein